VLSLGQAGGMVGWVAFFFGFLVMIRFAKKGKRFTMYYSDDDLYPHVAAPNAAAADPHRHRSRASLRK